MKCQTNIELLKRLGDPTIFYEARHTYHGGQTGQREHFEERVLSDLSRRLRHVFEVEHAHRDTGLCVARASIVAVGLERFAQLLQMAYACGIEDALHATPGQKALR